MPKVVFRDVSAEQESLTIDVLIGNDFMYELQGDTVIRGEPGEPVAVQTKLGWVLSGPLTGMKVASCGNSSVYLILDSSAANNVKSSMDNEVQKLWDLETIGIRATDEVHDDLLDNKSFTGKRLKGQLGKLKKEPEVLQTYDNIIKEQLKDGIIEKVAELEASER
eukprot:gene16152-biopygen907